MFTRALFEYGASSPAIREQCSRFKSLLWQFFRDILLQVLKPEPAERVAMMMVMLIDGAIAAQQAESAECREIPPGDRTERGQSAYLLRRRYAVR